MLPISIAAAAASPSLAPCGASPARRRLVQMAQGLGFAPDLVIDQHFRRRDRMGRLITALSYNPEPLGVGVDEDTAAVIGADGVLTVLGSGAVTVVDASGLRFTDSHAVHRGQPVAMLGLKVDFLTSGCRYDLRRRAGLAPQGANEGLAAAAAIEIGSIDR
jgi:cyanophycinase